MTVLLFVLSFVLILTPGTLLVAAVRLMRQAPRRTVALETRVARLQEALDLLTDTAETGFREMATEIERISAGSDCATWRPWEPTGRSPIGGSPWHHSGDDRGSRH